MLMLLTLRHRVCSQTCAPTLPRTHMVFRRVAFALRGTVPSWGSFKTMAPSRAHHPLSSSFSGFISLHPTLLRSLELTSYVGGSLCPSLVRAFHGFLEGSDVGNRQWLRHFHIRCSVFSALEEQGFGYPELVPPAPAFAPEA